MGGNKRTCIPFGMDMINVPDGTINCEESKRRSLEEMMLMEGLEGSGT